MGIFRVYHGAASKRLLACGVMLTMATFAALAQPSFAGPNAVGTIDVPGLVEASGIVSSRDQPGVLWTHNDGETPVVYALDSSGALLRSYSFPKFAIDIEDIAIGPGPVTNTSYLYIGDIGDNGSTRPYVQIFRVPEPSIYSPNGSSPTRRILPGVQTLLIRYPDHPHNAETLMIDPVSGDLFIVTKEWPAQVYTASRAQLDQRGAIMLSFVTTIPLPVPSGGDISAHGDQLLVRNEQSALWWSRSPGQSIGDALGGQPWDVPLPRPNFPEPNGEGIGFDSLGTGYFTISDSALVQPLYFFQQAPAGNTPKMLVGSGSTWSYLDNGINPGAGWRSASFDDTAWKTGEARFGYGRGSPVRTSTARTRKAVTTWFRKTFVAPSSATDLWLKLIFDDGAAVYLNGAIALSRNLPEAVAFDTRATAKQQALRDSWFTFRLDPALLLPGTNTLAVEIHQNNPSSADMRFDAQLIAVSRPE